MLTKVEADLASKKKRRVVEVAKAKEKLIEVYKRAEEKAMEAYMSLVYFIMEKAIWSQSFEC